MKNAASGALGAVAGLAVAGVFCYVGSLPKPEDPEPTRILTPCPVESYKVKFTTDTTDASKIVVDKETVGTAYKGDIVKFVNGTESEITIDFSSHELGTPFYGNPTFTIAPPGDGSNVEAKVVAIHAPDDPPDGTDYVYDTIPPTDQSPRVRIGPRRPCVQDE
jgi:hypothetical protein